MAQDSTITKVQSWITPILLCIIGFFTKGKLDKIDKTLDDISGIKAEQAVMKENISTLKTDMSDLKSALYVSGFERMVGKHEDFYTLPKHK